MRSKLLIVFVCIVNYTTFGNSFVWGPTGHRTTGEIAEMYLTKRAKRKINKLLKGESLAFVSTYADEIKSDREYDQFYTWHYVSFPLGTRYEDSDKNPKGDIITGINHCIFVLKDICAKDADKRFYLKMLVHLLGDLHQPLHIGRKEDKGGNTIQVQWFGNGTNLHHVWDEDMINKWDMSYVELANNAQELSKSEIESIQKGTVLDWLYDTRKYTAKVYNSVEPGQNLRYKYSYDYFPLVRKQLQKGGLRLAKILNEIFD